MPNFDFEISYNLNFCLFNKGSFLIFNLITNTIIMLLKNLEFNQTKTLVSISLFITDMKHYEDVIIWGNVIPPKI